MNEFGVGDRVRIDIPDETDPDHRFHGSHGNVVDVIDDDAGIETGQSQDSRIFRVEFDESATIQDFRRRDLRPPIDE